ncbi:MAG: transcription antitermination factor NusB [Bacilli bacterium]|nr:transcription antitermination factor NusB [Bacilli bacterium]
MKRTISRIRAMIYLYNLDLLKRGDNELNTFLESDIEYDKDFYNQLVDGVIKNIKEIDKIISINLSNWTIDRLSYIDRNLIRIGVYELKYVKTPKSIVMNEIIEISKEYSQTEDYQTSKFNNSLLERIVGYINGK